MGSEVLAPKLFDTHALRVPRAVGSKVSRRSLWPYAFFADYSKKYGQSERRDTLSRRARVARERAKSLGASSTEGAYYYIIEMCLFSIPSRAGAGTDTNAMEELRGMLVGDAIKLSDYRVKAAAAMIRAGSASKPSAGKRSFRNKFDSAKDPTMTEWCKMIVGLLWTLRNHDIMVCGSFVRRIIAQQWPDEITIMLHPGTDMHRVARSTLVQDNMYALGIEMTEDEIRFKAVSHTVSTVYINVRIRASEHVCYTNIDTMYFLPNLLMRSAHFFRGGGEEMAGDHSHIWGGQDSVFQLIGRNDGVINAVKERRATRPTHCCAVPNNVKALEAVVELLAEGYTFTSTHKCENGKCVCATDEALRHYKRRLVETQIRANTVDMMTQALAALSDPSIAPKNYITVNPSAYVDQWRGPIYAVPGDITRILACDSAPPRHCAAHA